jgi:hypothetical protein
MGVQEAGVYWPFKSLLSGSGIVLTETTTGITIATTGAGPGGGDMLISVFATNGTPGVVDKAVSAQTVTGVVAHATLADQIPWGGITGAPTIFPTDWSVIANKPATFIPSPHAPTHVTGGNDLIPLATTLSNGLLGPLSGKRTDVLAGDGKFYDLNATVGSYLLTLNSGLVVNGNTALNGGATIAGTTTIASAGNYCGILSNTGNAMWSWATGTALNKDAIVLYRAAGQGYLIEQYNDATGLGVWSGRLMNTWNPDGSYTMRAGTQIILSGSLPGNYTAYVTAPIRIDASAVGGFTGIGFQCNGYWGCALGAWQSGLWIATSSNTFVQLTDNSGHIPGSALASGAVSANLGYRPVSTNGDTMVGNLSVSKANAQIIAYQDGNNYCELLAQQGIYVVGNFGSGAQAQGQIAIQATNGPFAGISFRTTNGWLFTLFADSNGHFYVMNINTNQLQQLI